MRSDVGIGDGGRPLLAQRMVRSQLLYMDNGMSESDAYKRVRAEYDDDLQAFRHLIRRDDIKEELAAALTADVTTLKKAHRIWVDTITARVTGFNPISVHFTSVQSDGLPTLRELLMKSMPRNIDDNKPSAEVQTLLSDAYHSMSNDESKQFTSIFDYDDNGDVINNSTNNTSNEAQNTFTAKQ